jgi:hypothetical protein
MRTPAQSDARTGAASGGARAPAWQQPGLDAVAFEVGQIVDEHLAHQMIHFVLDAHRQQAVGLQFERLAVAVERAHGDALGGVTLSNTPGTDRQPSSLSSRPDCGDDLGVDEHAQLVVGLGDVDDDHALVNVDLGRGQPDAGGGVHGLGHVVDQLTDARIHRRNRLGYGVETRIGIMQNIESGHY